jgi:hypothetical protein
MQDGSVTPRVRPVGWAWSVGHRPGAIPSCVQVYMLCRVLIYTYSCVLGHGHAFDSSVLMFWDIYLPL